MSTALKRKSEALAELEAKFRCDHEHVELRRRVVRSGVVQRVEQCLRCGKATSQPVGRESALARCGGQEPPPFDDALMHRWEQAYKAGVDEIIKGFESRQEYEREQFFRRYDKYLRSEEWKAKRSRVLHRARGVCEGCGEAKATEVHHLSYRNVGAEFLFELVAVCEKCHERLHADEKEQEVESQET